jgi:hypothetical protein
MRTGTVLELQTFLCQTILPPLGGLKQQFKLCGMLPDFLQNFLTNMFIRTSFLDTMYEVQKDLQDVSTGKVFL